MSSDNFSLCGSRSENPVLSICDKISLFLIEKPQIITPTIGMNDFKRSIASQTFLKIFVCVFQSLLHSKSRKMRTRIGNKSCFFGNSMSENGNIGKSTQYFRIFSDKIIIDTF